MVTPGDGARKASGASAVIYILDHLTVSMVEASSMKSQIDQWENSLAVRIPKPVIQELDLKANDAIEFSVVNGMVVFKPIQALPKLTLDQLLDCPLVCC